jgi:hypothetical protein
MSKRGQGLRGIYSIRKHVVKPKLSQQNNKESITVAGASVFSSRFSVSLNDKQGE